MNTILCIDIEVNLHVYAEISNFRKAKIIQCLWVPMYQKKALLAAL